MFDVVMSGPALAAEPATVVALGDSLTAGYGLAPEEGFVSQLQSWLDALVTVGLMTVAAQPAEPLENRMAGFDMLYSSGTTGDPKGIVQGHGMRWAHVRRGATYQYGGPDGVTLLSTPLYSNTTLVVFFPTIAWGGTVVLMPKFDAGTYLQLAEQHRVTHTMLVPVQYQRLMAHPAFDQHDLSAFKFKFSTSAPFGAALKAIADAIQTERERLLEPRHDEGRQLVDVEPPPSLDLGGIGG